MLQYFSNLILRFCGWKLEGTKPSAEKLVIIGAPHTSNWDFPLSLLALSALGMRFSWVGKHTLFRPPFGLLFKAIGGIPVDRSKRSSFIDMIVTEFTNRERLALAIAPEGTRGKANHWKAGFYYIAMKANVEILLAYVNYDTKTIGLGPQLTPTGDVEQDFVSISKFYKPIRGKYPDQQNDLRLRKKEILLLHRQLSTLKKEQSQLP